MSVSVRKTWIFSAPAAIMLWSLASIALAGNMYIGRTGHQHQVINRTKPEVIQYASSKQAKENPFYTFYIQAGLHGNERLTTDFVNWLSQRIKAGKSVINRLDQYNIRIDMVPVANPSGYENFSRYNENAVNLNRNFDVLWGLSKEYPGQTSFSERETRFVKSMFDKNRYTAAIDVHGYAHMAVAPSDIQNEFGQNSMINGKYRHQWVNALERNIHKQFKSYDVTTALELGDGGAFEDWAYWRKGALSFCLEMHSPFRHYSTDKKLANDSYLEYELLIFNMFSDAITIENDRRKNYDFFIATDLRKSNQDLDRDSLIKFESMIQLNTSLLH